MADISYEVCTRLQLPKFGTELPAPKKEKKDKPKSETVRKLIEEKEREKRLKEEHERRKQREEEKRRLEEEKKKRFVIPKKKHDPSSNASPASSHSNVDSIIAEETSSRGSSPNLSTKEDKEKYTVLKDRDSKSHHRHHSSSPHTSSHHKHQNSHKGKVESSSSGKDNRSSESSNKDHRKSSGKHRDGSSSSSHHSSEKSEHSDKRDKSHHSSSDKLDASHSKSSSRSENYNKHKHEEKRDSKDRTNYIEKSDKYKTENSSKYRHGSSSKHNSERSSDHKHSSSRSESHSSHNSSKTSDKTINANKVSAKSLSLDELRAQVRQMKQDLEPLEKVQETSKGAVTSNVNPNMFQPHKNRQGIEMSETEKRKAQILSKTQLILQRTKERLAREQEDAKQPKKRLGKTSAGAKKEKDVTGQVKSKSLCKDDDSEGDDEPVNLNFDHSFNEEYLTQEPGSILKTIKNKIDEKLSSYNFPDKPTKEKHIKERKEKPLKERKEKILKEKLKKDKHKEDRAIGKEKNKESFGSGDDLKQNKLKKNKIIRRHQFQPAPMNFQDLLRLAETKSKEVVVEPEPVFKPPKKEERPMTQEEKERLERQKESRKRVKEEEAEFKKRTFNGQEDRLEKSSVSKADVENRVNSWLSDNKKSSQKVPEKDGSKLKAALTGNHTVPVLEKFAKPGMISSKPSAFAKQNQIQEKEKSSKYDSENENIISCGPSTAKPSKPVNPYMNQSTNPWDRITGQMKKNNPKPVKRKPEVMESSEEENEDEYDEDDDFIDDDDAGDDYSAHIRKIFGYDKRKYKDEDEDDSNMEANFSTIMKEEARSARIGLKEDLEDMRREEEELRMKKLSKMKKMKYR